MDLSLAFYSMNRNKTVSLNKTESFIFRQCDDNKADNIKQKDRDVVSRGSKMAAQYKYHCEGRTKAFKCILEACDNLSSKDTEQQVHSP